MSDENVKKNVREFYDRVGWKKDDDVHYQNAQYEDLRPVSQEYIHRCHMRVKRHLPAGGAYLLDAGSGPVQYPEYEAYSEGYHARVCMDISIVALQEARKRLGEHGLYVVGDVAHLPFRSDVFDGIVSLHTIHHVPMEDKISAYEELYRTLTPGRQMVVVNGWTNAPLMVRLNGFRRFVKRMHDGWLRNIKKQTPKKAVNPAEESSTPAQDEIETERKAPSGTYVQKLNAKWLTNALEGKMDFRIQVWRSVSVPFLRSVFYADWGGRFWLKVLYALEEIFPEVLGRLGQYPLIVISKPDQSE